MNSRRRESDHFACVVSTSVCLCLCGDRFAMVVIPVPARLRCVVERRGECARRLASFRLGAQPERKGAFESRAGQPEEARQRGDVRLVPHEQVSIVEHAVVPGWDVPTRSYSPFVTSVHYSVPLAEILCQLGSRGALHLPVHLIERGQKERDLFVQLEGAPRLPPYLGEPAVVHRHDGIDRLTVQDDDAEPQAEELADVPMQKVPAAISQSPPRS